MTPTGHWNRIDQRTSELWPQSVLEQEKRKWQAILFRFRDAVNSYILNGGNVNRSRVWVFEFIVRQSIIEIQDKIDTLKILESAALTASSPLSRS
jgi:hypothetical protein